jgi:tRNA (pseudouridine54-N1)-methyltransferase
MRQFVVVGHDAPTTGDFSLDDLSGAGRLDLLARCVIDGLLTSHGIREGGRVHLVLRDDVTLRLDGATLRNLHPDERSAAALIRSALAERDRAVGHQPVEVSPGLSLVGVGLAETLDALADAGPLVRLGLDGAPARETPAPSDPVFVLSDHRAFSDADRAVLDERTVRTVSLGPVALHANQAITVAHNWLDTADGGPV